MGRREEGKGREGKEKERKRRGGKRRGRVPNVDTKSRSTPAHGGHSCSVFSRSPILLCVTHVPAQEHMFTYL